MAFESVAVLGAGVMGSGIAAHVANAGVPVVLLDIVSEGTPRRDVIAAGALERMLRTEPAPFMHRRNARLVTTGNLEDDLGLVAGADWIVEAVVERLDVKRDLYRRVDSVRKPGALVSSNTSTIPLSALTEGMPEGFRKDFLITHFFNPPRYMRLLEIVAGADTRPEAASAIEAFADHALGKGVVRCKDTPGFIGNRVGVYWLQCAVLEAISAGLDVEDADAVVGRPMGIPKTGVFGLSDLVGIDLMPHVLASLDGALPEGDAFREYAEVPDLVRQMIADGRTGRKGKGGFYRINHEGGRRVKEALDLPSGTYRTARTSALASLQAARAGGLRALVGHEDAGGRYAWRVLAKTLGYAASLVPEIADDVASVDSAMRLGYNWAEGPFQLIDRLGTDWFAERLAADGLPVPDLMQVAAGRPFYRVESGLAEQLGPDGAYHPIVRPEGVELLADVRHRGRALAHNGSASLWDVGDGVVCFQMHTKLNAIDPDVLALLRESLGIVQRDFEALVLHTDAENFSVGVNLGLALFAANIAAWDQIEALVAEGQDTYAAVRNAPFPVVGAPAGLALGGGCEMLLHCDAVVAHAETYMGLVEVGVGVIPAWGGCTELLARWGERAGLPGGPMPPVAKVFEIIGTAQVARSAAQAADLLLLRPQDTIVMNRDRLLATAKSRALAMAKDYHAPAPRTLRLPGPSARAAMAMVVAGYRNQGKATAHDEVVADALAEVLSGGDSDVTAPIGAADLLALERRAFMRLVREPGTLARVEHMLETGKPLRN